MRNVLPHITDALWANRHFVRRVVCHAVNDLGITQFLDLGAGIPTMAATHEVACSRWPDARCVYVDIDPFVVAIWGLQADDGEPFAVVQADFCEPDALLAAVKSTGYLDLTQPLALIAAGLLHFLPPALQPGWRLAQYQKALAPGSILAVTQMTTDGVPGIDMDNVADFERVWNIQSGTSFCFRNSKQFADLLDGWHLDSPVTWAPLWRPDPYEANRNLEPARSMLLAGVGCVPATSPRPA